MPLIGQESFLRTSGNNEITRAKRVNALDRAGVISTKNVILGEVDEKYCVNALDRAGVISTKQILNDAFYDNDVSMPLIGQESFLRHYYM